MAGALRREARFCSPTDARSQQELGTMASDLVASIMRFLTPDMIARIATALGINRQAVEQAITAAVPTILAGLAGTASKPEGTQRLASVLMQQPPGLLDDLRHSLGSAEQGSVAEHGASVLSALLGGGTMKSVAAAVTDFAGLKEGGGKTILGLLAPVVLGVLGQQQRVSGLDASGIADMIAKQKDSIAAALPRGFADELGDSRILESIGETWRGTKPSAQPRPVEGEARPAYSADAQGAGSAQWALALVAVAAIGGLLWFLSTSPQPEQIAQRTGQRTPMEGRAVSVPAAISVPELTQQVAASVDGLKATLSGIADADSATDALPKLREAAANLDKLNGLAEKLPREGKQMIAAAVTSAMPAINELCEKVLADPSVASVARPLVEAVRAKLGSLGGA
jgi:hypothetical protein